MLQIGRTAWRRRRVAGTGRVYRGSAGDTGARAAFIALGRIPCHSEGGGGEEKRALVGDGAGEARGEGDEVVVEPQQMGDCDWTADRHR